MKLVVALGGNALGSGGADALLIKNQLKNASIAMKSVVSLAKGGRHIALTFGNGPQVGQIMFRNSAAFGFSVPLEVSVAESQGQIGYVLEQALLNELSRRKISKQVVNVLTHVVVDKNDPAFLEPTKPVGNFYSEKEAKLLMEKGGILKEDAGRGYRVVVASPVPLEIVEEKPIAGFFSGNSIVIACGGGGIPVAKVNGKFVGVPAVIDKDLASALLANRLNADVLLMLTEVKNVFLNFGKKNQQPIKRMCVGEAKKYLLQGHFLSGSMGPKIVAAINFLNAGGKKAVICSLSDGLAALEGRAGTTILK